MFRAVVMDIEGTTTPVRFVYDVLFPYALERLSEGMTEEDVEAFREQARLDEGLPGVVPVVDRASALANARLYMAEDRKVGCLKALQGRIWRGGYEDGTLRSEVYEDVPRALARWRSRGVRCCIYSSGSVEAQRLLFRYSAFGDLTGLLDGYFDTTTGPKRSSSSYASIVSSLGLPAAEVLFLTDVLEEAAAAREAGLQTRLVVRPGNAPLLAEHGFEVVRTFDEVP